MHLNAILETAFFLMFWVHQLMFSFGFTIFIVIDKKEKQNMFYVSVPVHEWRYQLEHPSRHHMTMSNSISFHLSPILPQYDIHNKLLHPHSGFIFIIKWFITERGRGRWWNWRQCWGLFFLWRCVNSGVKPTNGERRMGGRGAGGRESRGHPNQYSRQQHVASAQHLLSLKACTIIFGRTWK